MIRTVIYTFSVIFFCASGYIIFLVVTLPGGTIQSGGPKHAAGRVSETTPAEGSPGKRQVPVNASGPRAVKALSIKVSSPSQPSNPEESRASSHDFPSAPENKEEVLKSITLEGDLFDSSQVRSSSYLNEEIKDVLVVIKAYPNAFIEVEGHTDNIPIRRGRSKLPFSDNVELSLWRAKTVASKLMESGLDPRRIRVTGYGETRPVASNETPKGRAKNRRVEIKLMSR